MKKHLLRLLIIIFPFLFLIQPAKSQEMLSLLDAINKGLENNFSIRISALEAEQAKNLNTFGQTSRYPTINFNISQNNSINKTENPTGYLRSGNIVSNSISPGITLNWVIFEGFKTYIDKEKLSLLEEQSEGNASLIIENTIQAIMLTYYQFVLLKERIDVQKKVLELSGDRYRYVMLRQELGNAVTFDVLQQKNAYLTDSSDLIIQQQNLITARRELNELMGIDIDTKYMPKDTLIANLEVYDFDELSARMASNNTNLRNQYINRELLKNELKSNKVNLWPTINASAGGSYSFNWSTLKNPEFSNPDMVYEENTAYTNPTNYYVNFTFNWLLFNGGKVKRAIKNSMINQRIGDLQIDEIKLSLNKDLLIAYDLYNTRKLLLQIAEENIKTAELNLQLADEKYKTGAISSIDYRIIQVDYQNTALSHLMAKYELILAKTELMRLTGVILSDYNN